jgi:acyl carrier protein
MISYEQALQLIQDSFTSLHASGLIVQDVTVNATTVIMGNGSILDSIAFVTLLTDLEDRLNAATQKEIYLVLNEITDFNINNPYLSAEIVAKYMMSLT